MKQFLKPLMADQIILEGVRNGDTRTRDGPTGRERRLDERVQLVLPRQGRARRRPCERRCATSRTRPGYRPGDYDMAIATIHEARFVLFDDDTRLLFATSFDGPWDAYMEDFFTSGPTLALFDVIFRHVEGYDGLPDLAAVQSFVLGAQVTAAAYARNYGGTVKEIRKAERVNEAFQQVLDDPEAAEALQHPALKPLLDEAAD